MSCVTWCDYAGVIPDKTDPDSQLLTWSMTLATFSNWFRNEILKMTYGEAPTYPADGTFYIGIHSTLSYAEAPGIEFSGNNYSRTTVTFERVSDIMVWNPTDRTGQTASADWAPALSFTLWDALTGGNYYAFGNLRQAVTILEGKAPKWPANTGVMIGMGSTPSG